VTVTRDLPPGYRKVAFEEIDSTNDEALRRVRSGRARSDEVAVIVAACQASGRGRQGRRWQSPSGNLYMTLLAAAPDRRHSPELAFVAAVAVGESVSAALPGKLTLGYKWPNDLMCGSRKVGGILIEIETSPDGADFAAIGIGLNVARAPDGLAPAATALAAEGAAAIAAGSLVAPICKAFGEWRARWLAQGFAPVRANWLAGAQGLGAAVVVRTGEGTLDGVFEGLDEKGRLVLLQGASRRRIAAAELLTAGV